MYFKCIIIWQVFILTTSINVGISQTFNEFDIRNLLNNTDTNNVKPSWLKPQSTNKIRLLQDDVKELKFVFDQLKMSNSLNDEDKSAIENILDNTNILLANQDREIKQSLEDVQKTLGLLLKLIARLTKTQEETQRKLSELQEENKRKSMLNDVLFDVRSLNYAAALEKIKTIDDAQKNRFIVKELYRNQLGNFDLILNFARSIEDPSVSLSIMNSLYDEMTSNDHRDVEKLIDLMDLIETVRTKTANSNLREKEHLSNAIRETIEMEAIKYIKDDMLKRCSRTNEIVDSLTPKIMDFGNAMRNVVDSVYNRIGVNEMIDYFDAQLNATQKIIALDAIYATIKSRNELNSQATIALALGLKKVIASDGGGKNHYESLKRKLSECVRNAVLEPQVCIRSARFNEYFYAASIYQYDASRRRVFTWKPGGKSDVPMEFWTFEAEDGNFYIKNAQFNEYLYAAEGFNIDNERRRVFTWIPGGHSAKGQEYWRLEPHGDHCYIKNVHFDEYFYPIDAEGYDANRRRVATWIPKGCDSQCLWKIEKCG